MKRFKKLHQREFVASIARLKATTEKNESLKIVKNNQDWVCTNLPEQRRPKQMQHGPIRNFTFNIF